jgi:hypothetical protein
MHVQIAPLTHHGLVDHETEVQLDPRWGEWGKRFTDLRFVMLHVLKETAAHAGHLDAAAELLDGRQWIVLSDS